jgi:NADP-dependent 3-hydroxy acid dehydrogenase YdfG
VVINNAGLALGAPKRFPELKLEDIDTMVQTNLSGMLYTTHAALNVGGMLTRKQSTILNITSTTALEVPPFPGESIYHTTKAAQEAFTNSLRTELGSTNIKCIALRPGVVATHFHQQRVGYDREAYDEFMAGFEPLVAEDVARQCIWQLSSQERVSIKAVDVVPTAQRMLYVIDKEWNGRNGIGDQKMQQREK